MKNGEKNNKITSSFPVGKAMTADTEVAGRDGGCPLRASVLSYGHMRILACRDLGGPCDAKLSGNSFSEIGAASHVHVMERIRGGDSVHKVAAEKMRAASPDQLKAWMTEWEKNFNDAPEA